MNRRKTNRLLSNFFTAAAASLLAVLASLSAGESSRAQDFGSSCAPPSSAGTGVAAGSASVLIGRFTTLGSSAAGSSLDPEAIGSILRPIVNASLLEDPGVKATIWDSGPEKPTEDSSGLTVNNAFIRGTTTNSLSDRDLEALAGDLRTRKCDFLFGGTVTVREELVLITPYLFDVKRRTIEVPFDPVRVRGKGGIAEAGLALGSSLAKALSDRRRPDDVSFVHFYVGCFQDQRNDGATVAKATDGLTRSISAELSADPNYGPAVRPLGGLCDVDAIPKNVQKAALLTGIIGSTSKVATVQPRFELLFRPNSKMSILLDRHSGRTLEALDLTFPYLGEARTLIIALGLPEFQKAIFDDISPTDNSEGAASTAIARVVEDVLSTTPPLPTNPLPLNATEATTPGNPNALKQNASIAEAFAVAYRILSRSAGDVDVAALSHYALGVALQALSENRLAYDHLMRSFALRESISRENSPARYEALGNTLAALGASDGALTIYERAVQQYSSLAAKTVPGGARSRVLKAISQIQIRTGNFPDAKKHLEQIADLSNDYEALMSLAEISSTQNELMGAQGAVRWYSDALKLKPNASDVRLKIARVYGSLAEQSDKRGDLTNAERYYRLALDQTEDQQYRVQVGLIAYREGKYGSAAEQFRIATKATPSTASQIAGEAKSPWSFGWQEAAWLNLIESETLNCQFTSADMDGAQAADNIFAHVPESRVIANYLRTIARAVNPDHAGSLLERDIVYEDTMDQAKKLSEHAAEKSTLTAWDNSVVSNFYKTALSAKPDKITALTELEKTLALPVHNKTSTLSTCINK